jgi:hypothetical protein
LSALLAADGGWLLVKNEGGVAKLSSLGGMEVEEERYVLGGGENGKVVQR